MAKKIVPQSPEFPIVMTLEEKAEFSHPWTETDTEELLKNWKPGKKVNFASGSKEDLRAYFYKYHGKERADAGGFLPGVDIRRPLDDKRSQLAFPFMKVESNQPYPDWINPVKIKDHKIQKDNLWMEILGKKASDYEENASTTTRRIGEIHPTERPFFGAHAEEGLPNDFWASQLHGGPAPSGWKFTPESNGVPSGFIHGIEESVAHSSQKIAGRSSFLKRNWKLAAGGAALLGFIGYRISGKDDDYNNIEGLLHGGSAQDSRRKHTEFGSGWKGLVPYIEKAGPKSTPGSIEQKKEIVYAFLKKAGISTENLGAKFSFPIEKSAAKSIFKDLASQYHPDRGGTTEGFQTFQGIYDKIHSREKIESYHFGSNVDTFEERIEDFFKGSYTDHVRNWKSRPGFDEDFSGPYPTYEQWTNKSPEYEAFRAAQHSWNAKQDAKWTAQEARWKVEQEQENIKYEAEWAASRKEYQAEADARQQEWARNNPIQNWVDTKAAPWLRRNPKKSIVGALGVSFGTQAIVDRLNRRKRISGKDDAYNTIEGLRHGGAAQQSRKRHTEFGSGWRGLIGGIKNARRFTADEFKTLLHNADPEKFAHQFKDIASARSAGFVIPEGASALGAFTTMHETLGRATIVDEQHVSEMFKAFLVDEKQATFIAPLTHFHELSESWHMKRITDNVKAATKEDLLPVELHNKAVRQIQENMISSHASMAVIADEALAAASLGRESFQAMKEFRYAELWLTETKASEPGFRGEGIVDYVKRTKKIYESVEEKWLPRFELPSKNDQVYSKAPAEGLSKNLLINNKIKVLPGVAALGLGIYYAFKKISGKDDDYNTIEGLRHGGQAEVGRKKNTPFGSGWDPLRNKVANFLGKEAGTFEKFISSEGFKSSLKAGKFVKNLGKGSFGSVELLSTNVTIGSHTMPFQFARKATQMPDNYVMKEVAAMSVLGHLNAPTFYGMHGNEILMEHIQGEMAHDIMLGGGKISPEAIKDLSQFTKEAHAQGFSHSDMTRDVGLHHAGSLDKVNYTGEMIPHNVIITPEGRAGVIDWGEVQPAMARGGKGQEGFATSVERAHEAYLGKPAGEHKVAADLDNALIEGLQRQGGKISPQYQKPAYSPHKPHQSLALAKTQSSSKLKKLGMAQTQRQTTAKLFGDALNGAKKSKSTFAASAKTARG